MKTYLRAPHTVLALFFLSLLLLFVTAFILLPLPGDVPVLMYHFVRNEAAARASKNNVSAISFQRQMQFLKRFGYHVITLDELYATLKGERIPRGREVVITFDDGNYTFEKNAYPILQPYAFPVTLFLVSENVKQQANGSMNEEAVKRLMTSGWISLGSHSRTHPVLAELNDDAIRQELAGSKKDLEKMFGIPIRDLAYPSGIFDSRVTRIAEEAGYRLAFTTSRSLPPEIPRTNYSIRRIKVSRTSDHPFVFWLKISGIYTFFKDQIEQLKKWGKAGAREPLLEPA